jgi:hypothetical protein
MNFYHVTLNGCANFDKHTVIIKDQLTSRIRATNVGLVFDNWPIDDLFISHPEIFCTERFKSLWSSDYRHFSGLEFDKITRVSTDSNWKYNYKKDRPGHYWHVNPIGVAFVDDIAVYSDFRYLIVSRQAVDFLLQNHASEIFGEIIHGPIDDYFSGYKEKLKSSNYLYILPKLKHTLA